MIDNVPRFIDHSFMRAVAKGLQDKLMSGLFLDTERATERAAFYDAEDIQVKAERSLLGQKKARLDKVFKELHKFQM